MGRRAVFLDRDGTVILERSYLSDPDGVEVVPGGAAAIRRLKEAGWAVVIVTNQSGIARGLYSEADYRAVRARLDEVLEAEGAGVEGSWHCPHHPDHSGPCDCRKPGTGMYRAAAEELDLDLERSWYVGDRVKDVEPASTLGGRGILVRTGYGTEEERHLPDGAEVARDLSEAAEIILREGTERGAGTP